MTAVMTAVIVMTTVIRSHRSHDYVYYDCSHSHDYGHVVMTAVIVMTTTDDHYDSTTVPYCIKVVYS